MGYARVAAEGPDRGSAGPRHLQAVARTSTAGSQASTSCIVAKAPKRPDRLLPARLQDGSGTMTRTAARPDTFSTDSEGDGSRGRHGGEQGPQRGVKVPSRGQRRRRRGCREENQGRRRARRGRRSRGNQGGGSENERKRRRMRAGGGAAGATGTPGGRRSRCTSVKTKVPRRCEGGGGERKGMPAV